MSLTDKSIDVNKLFSLFALDVIISAAFGIQANIQTDADPEMVSKSKIVFSTPLWVRGFSLFSFSDYLRKKFNSSPLSHTDYFLGLARAIYDVRKTQE